jgi:DNA-binding SARP family transcriptional activator
LDFRILGRVEAFDDGRDVTPHRAQPRALLALFLLHPNERLATDRLIEALWGEGAPATADKALQGHVSTLRKALGATRIRTEAGAYRFEVRSGELDAGRFADALAAARSTRDPATRSVALAEALQLWRGEPLAEFGNERFAHAEIARLVELRLAASDARAEAELQLGRHLEALPDLELLVEEHPLHEGLRAKLMLALYRAGRQSDALRVFREGRRILAEELGIEPGSELQILERQVLAQDPAIAAPAIVASIARPHRQERKTVTVMVVEVVPGEPIDPEDLERVTRPELDRIRAAVERVGGTPEPLFANAVIGIFGAPRAHDDDAVRAIRAALDLLDPAAAGAVRLRGGIETGEALVTIDGTDVAVTGQVLGDASRLQTAAPPGSIVVGPAARRATESAIEYRQLSAGVWAPEAARAVDGHRPSEAPFVGRAAELELLERIYARARDERSVQLVTVMAEPGGGKSRLVRELRHSLEQQADAPTWRQGRSLPYGDGITYWALGEIVKAEARMLESDDAETSRRKLQSAVAELEPDASSRPWLEGSLAALVGIESTTATGDRGESFAAWQQFMEAIAASGPLVVVFEDIHWADAALLEFIEHLVRHAHGVPLMVVCTARLELLAAHPAWAAGIRNATSISLSPLSLADTETLLRGLLGHDPDGPMVRRAGGNPLFAHELAWITRQPLPDASASIPDSLQSVIAARLDTLSPELKAIASDAAVIGEVFWSGALVALGELAPRDAELRLQRLVENDIVRRRRSSSVVRQAEYEFLHVLVRDVAYGQIPRRDRIDKHRAAAEWIEAIAGDRPTSHAELVAHHYVESLELATRLDDVRAPQLRTKAREFLALAGDGARSRDVAQAASFYGRALDLTDDADPARGRLLARLGEVTQFTGGLREAEALTRDAVVVLDAQGDRAGSAAAMVTLVGILWRLGRSEGERRAILLGAIGILEGTPEGSDLVLAYSQMATLELYEGRAPECFEWATKAVRLADRLGATELKTDPLHLLGIARFEMGDLDGIADVRAGVKLGLEAGLGSDTGTAMSDLGATLWLSESPVSGLAAKDEAAAFAASRGLTYMVKTTLAESLWLQFDAGEWDALLDAANDLIEWERERGSGRLTMIALTAKARVLVSRGDVAGAVAIETELLDRARGQGDSQDLVSGLPTAAAIRSAAGDRDAALRLIAELAATTRDRDPSKRAHELPLATRICVAWGSADLARSMLPAGESNYLRSRLCIAASEAMLTEADGDLAAASRQFRAAALGWASYGNPAEEAFAQLGAGRCLVALGRSREAVPDLERARELATILGARPLIDEATSLRLGLGELAKP